VRAIVGGRDYGASQFNRATRALRQAGSSFKIYTYTAAMEAGLTPESTIVDGPISWGSWSPKNYGRSYAGRVTLTTAITKSLNAVVVRLAKEHLSIPVIKEEAIKMGVESTLSDHKTMVLGISGMTVLDQATGYNTLANGGFVGTRHAITQIMKRSGEVFYDFDRDGPKPKRVVSEKAMSEMNSMLVQVPEIGTAKRAALPGIRVAGKTGTTQSYRDAWFCGFTGNYTAAIWMGNDDFHPTRNMTGGSLPAMTWQRLMEYAHKNIDLKPIPGIENPFVDQETAAKVAEAVKAEAEKNAQEALDRPAVLSPATTRLLKQMSERFRAAPPIDPPAEPKTLSAL